MIIWTGAEVSRVHIMPIPWFGRGRQTGRKKVLGIILGGERGEKVMGVDVYIGMQRVWYIEAFMDQLVVYLYPYFAMNCGEDSKERAELSKRWQRRWLGMYCIQKRWGGGDLFVKWIQFTLLWKVSGLKNVEPYGMRIQGDMATACVQLWSWNFVSIFDLLRLLGVCVDKYWFTL